MCFYLPHLFLRQQNKKFLEEPRQLDWWSGTNTLALAEARYAVATGLDKQVDTSRRPFFYMPFEHSERMEDQKRSVELFTDLGNELYLDYAVKHREVIETFGRFPHRNSILGRENSAEEEAYLAKPGAGF